MTNWPVHRKTHRTIQKTRRMQGRNIHSENNYFFVNRQMLFKRIVVKCTHDSPSLWTYEWPSYNTIQKTTPSLTISIIPYYFVEHSITITLYKLCVFVLIIINILYRGYLWFWLDTNFGLKIKNYNKYEHTSKSIVNNIVLNLNFLYAEFYLLRSALMIIIVVVSPQ